MPEQTPLELAKRLDLLDTLQIAKDCIADHTNRRRENNCPCVDCKLSRALIEVTAERDALRNPLGLFDMHGQECGNCGVRLVTVNGRPALSELRPDTIAICGRCAGAEIDRVEKERDALQAGVDAANRHFLMSDQELLAMWNDSAAYINAAISAAREKV